MVSKKGSKGKGSKVSHQKLSNKHINKLARQGKLKKKLSDPRLRRQLQERTKKGREDPEGREARIEAEQEEEKNVDIPLEEADYEYFAKPGRDLNFLRLSADKDQKSKKRKRKTTDDDSLERNFEQGSSKRPTVNNDFKALLPIKGKAGLIARSETETAEDMEDAEEESQPQEENEVPLPPLSTSELFARRQQLISERKQRIATLGSAILENPQQNFGKLRELRLMLVDEEDEVAVTSMKIVMVSLCEIFKDIIPSYRIRVTTEAEKTQVAKKETKQLRDFEESLIGNYKHYLTFMESIIKGKQPRAFDQHKKKGAYIEIPETAVSSLRELGLRCFCDLLILHPHFNFRTNIITAILPYANNKNTKFSSLVCKATRTIFKEDKSGEVSLEIVRLLGRLIKVRNYDVQPCVLRTFLALRIRDVAKTKEELPDNKEKRRENVRNMSKKDRKRHKQMGSLTKELEDASVMDNKDKRLKVNTEIVNMIFLSYFRILKNGTDSGLLEPVLEGLAKFAHLINVDFFDDLFSVLNDLVDSRVLTYRESLHCVQTALTILTGQGAALSIDPLRFYRHLYNVLLTLNAGSSSQDIPIALDSLELMINKRKKQVSLPRVLAYTKRLATLSLQQTANGCLGVLAMLRSVIVNFAKCDILFDTDNQGSGAFLPELEEPEHCNAHNTTMWEIATLQCHFHPAVQKYATHIAMKVPSEGLGKLPPELLRKSPMNLWHEYAETEEKVQMNIPKKIKTRRKVFLPAEDRISESCLLADIPEFNFHGHFTHSISETPSTPMDIDANISSNGHVAGQNGVSKPIGRNKAKKMKYMRWKMSKKNKKTL